MPTPLGELGMQAASGAVNAGLGMLLSGWNDRRQLRQQDRLNQQQLGVDIQKMNYQQQQQMDFWNKTNYGAQIAHMKSSGVNPAILYGGGGAGGAVVGGGAAGVSAANAPSGGGEILGIQMANAQKALIEAQTEKTKAETIKTAGVDTKLGETQIQNLMTGMDTERAKQTMMKVQTAIQEIEQDLKTESYEDTLNTIRYNARMANKQLDILSNDKDISDATKQAKIDIIQGELIGLGLANEIKKLGMQLTEEQIKATKAGVAQGWKGLDIQQRNAMTNIANSKIAQLQADTNVYEFIERARNNQYGNEIAKGALDLQKMINDVPESTKFTVGTIMNVISILARKGTVINHYN